MSHTLTEGAREALDSARLSCVDLTAAAAFTAAGLSLVNVAATYHLARRGHREQWRRDQERPIVARCLTLSSDGLEALWDASVAKQEMSPDAAWVGSEAEQHRQAAMQAARDLRYEAAQLDLLASPPVRQAVMDLVVAHVQEAYRLMQTKPGDDDRALRSEERLMIVELERELVARTRIDLGLDSRQVNDTWIAACCLIRNLPLATLNPKDFRDFADHDGLVVIGINER